MNRAKREFIAKFPPATRLVQQRQAARVSRYRPSLPALDEQSARLMRQVNDTGVAATNLASLGVPGTERMLACLTELAEPLATQPPDTDSLVVCPRSDMLKDASVWQWGLADQLIDLAENHIGTPVTYYGALLVRQVADGRVVGDRRWHRDIEDHRMLKLLVWLSDVDVADGPFEYVPVESTIEATKTLNYVSGYVADNVMSSAAAPDLWRTATGPKGTATFADPARIFHRAQAPTARDRYSVTFSWTSRKPLNVRPSEPFSVGEMSRITAGLTDRQLACLPGRLTHS